MKRTLTLLFSALLTICAWAEDTEPKVVDDVYQISTASELIWFASHVNAGNTSANAVLTADIVVNENVLTDHVLNSGEFTQWSPIGTDNNPYHGTFDGQGHTVSGLFNNQGKSLTGFFGHIGNATIKNLGVTDTYFKCYQKSGGIAGFCAYDRQYFVFAIENCWFDGRIDAADFDISGILGGSWSSAESHITNCYNLGTISSTKSSGACVGGITGYCTATTTISNCFNYGEISGNGKTGSILGESTAKVENCYYLEGSALNSGEVSGGIGNGSDSEGVVEAATAEQFASGEICYKLNGDQSSIAFGQIHGSGLPSLTSDAVVYRSHTGCSTYTNNPAEATDEERMHNIILVAETAPVSGVSHGVAAYYECSVCNALFADADGKTPLNSESLCLHDFVDGECSVCHQHDSKFIYEIATLDDLYTFAEKVNNGWTTLNAVLTADIVVNANVLTDHVLNSGEFTQWSPIGTDNNPYHGTFDGQGHTVSGLFNNQGKSLTGFFGHIGNATIKNLGVTDTYFKCYQKSGGIAGFCAYDRQYFVFAIENCWFDGRIDAADFDISGILGGSWSSAESHITNCYNLGTISSTKSSGACVGGITGYCTATTTISNCFNYGEISGNGKTGSILGESTAKVENCYYLEGSALNSGEVSGGIGNGSDSEGVVEAATAEQFASGEICYKLNGDQSKIVYHQNLDGSVVAPNFTSKDVVILDGENYVNAPSIPTAVKNINADKREKAIKTIEDGKVVIIRDGEKYDLAGRKL
ncbi:MAG: hypothetical protein MJZ01_07580 [Bacteroidales bacterium]|nr:hypothetical protein [Bacteroidales bacterium]